MYSSLLYCSIHISLHMDLDYFIFNSDGHSYFILLLLIFRVLCFSATVRYPYLLAIVPFKRRTSFTKVQLIRQHVWPWKILTRIIKVANELPTHQHLFSFDETKIFVLDWEKLFSSFVMLLYSGMEKYLLLFFWF